MKLKIAFLVVAIPVLIGICYAICYAIYSAYQVAAVDVPNAYATDWASEFVVEHLKSNNNQWPRGWDDLRDEFDRLAEPNHYPWPGEELQQRVTIDWDADPLELVNADPEVTPPFHVIRLSDGSSSHWEGAEPNRKVLEYLLKSKVTRDPP